MEWSHILLVLLSARALILPSAVSMMNPEKEMMFCQALPKIECHAHLSGSIPYATLREMDHQAPNPAEYTNIDEFFRLFNSYIYKILDTPSAVTKVTAAVLDSFMTDGCIYLELRTTPRQLSGRPIHEYLNAVYRAIDEHDQSAMMVKLILSVNWDSPPEKVREVVNLAIEEKNNQRPVVGIDVCGDPRKSELYARLIPELRRARKSGLKLTVHFAEVLKQKTLLENHLFHLKPDRLGHATFLTEPIQEDIISNKRPIEVCIASNVKGGTVSSPEEHHFKWAVDNGVPVLISTDDTLFFGTTLTNEYQTALRLLHGDTEKLLETMKDATSHTFCSEEEKNWIRARLDNFIEENGYQPMLPN